MLLAADPDFNADFYVAVATVLPILYILIVVQFGLFRRAVEDAAAGPSGKLRWPSMRQFGFYIVMGVFGFVFVVGEWGALVALDNRSISGLDHGIVSTTTAILLFGSLVVCFVAWLLWTAYQDYAAT